MSNHTESKPSWGVVVGRFQVNALHDGHRDLFDQVTARHNPSHVIVFVGRNPAGLSKDHPLDFATRAQMIKADYPEFVILPLDDTRNDESWSKELDHEIAKIVHFGSVTLYGGRDSFVPHYHGRHTPVELALDPRKHKISGTDVRREFANTILQSADFRAGMIYAAANIWPQILPCVDIAPLSDDRTEVLLGKRESEDKWRFLGGHAEKKHGMINPYERGASAESMEEGGVDLIDQEYVGSAIVNDWRVRDCPDKTVMTSFFAGRVSNMAATAGDDIDEVKWFKLANLTTFHIVPEHAVLLTMLHTFLKEKYAETVSTTTTA